MIQQSDNKLTNYTFKSTANSNSHLCGDVLFSWNRAILLKAAVTSVLLFSTELLAEGCSFARSGRVSCLAIVEISNECRRSHCLRPNRSPTWPLFLFGILYFCGVLFYFHDVTFTINLWMLRCLCGLGLGGTKNLRPCHHLVAYRRVKADSLSRRY